MHTSIQSHSRPTSWICDKIYFLRIYTSWLPISKQKPCIAHTHVTLAPHQLIDITANTCTPTAKGLRAKVDQHSLISLTFFMTMHLLPTSILPILQWTGMIIPVVSDDRQAGSTKALSLLHHHCIQVDKVGMSYPMQQAVDDRTLANLCYTVFIPALTQP